MCSMCVRVRRSARVLGLHLGGVGAQLMAGCHDLVACRAREQLEGRPRFCAAPLKGFDRVRDVEGPELLGHRGDHLPSIHHGVQRTANEVPYIIPQQLRNMPLAPYTSGAGPESLEPLSTTSYATCRVGGRLPRVESGVARHLSTTFAASANASRRVLHELLGVVTGRDTKSHDHSWLLRRARSEAPCQLWSSGMRCRRVSSFPKHASCWTAVHK